MKTFSANNPYRKEVEKRQREVDQARQELNALLKELAAVSTKALAHEKQSAKVDVR